MKQRSPDIEPEGSQSIQPVSERALEDLAFQLRGRDLNAVLAELDTGSRELLLRVLSEAGRVLPEVKACVTDLSASGFSEVQRVPQEAERTALALSTMLALFKRSKVEWDTRHAESSIREVFRGYRSLPPEDREKIIRGHREHRATLTAIACHIDPARSLISDGFAPEVLRNHIQQARAVLIAGGDDHFKSVAWLIENEPVVAINSSPGLSNGVLTSWSLRSLDQLFAALKDGQFLIEEWVRIEIAVQYPGESEFAVLPPAFSEVSIADDKTLKTMRGSIVDEHGERPLKGSGLLISTGAGSTGWAGSANRYLFPHGRVWPRTEQRIEYYQREPYGELSAEVLAQCSGQVMPGRDVLVKSSSNHNPIISVDGAYNVPFPRGSVARVRISDMPLKVVVPA